MRHVLLVLLTLGGPALAHSRLTAPVPRNDFDDIKDSNALHPPPCGGPRGTVVMAKQVGDLLQVEWDETIDHLGHYEILFSTANDQNFAFLSDPNGVTLNNIADVQGGTLPHHYKQMVKLPSTPCDACTLQVKQYMDGAGYYMSCADMQLTTQAAGVDGGVAAADGGAADLGGVPQMQPSSPSPMPSMQPAADDPTPMPDLAMPPPEKPGPTQYDYSYGCSAAPGAAAGALPFVLLLVGVAFVLRRRRVG